MLNNFKIKFFVDWFRVKGKACIKKFDNIRYGVI